MLQNHNLQLYQYFVCCLCLLVNVRIWLSTLNRTLNSINLFQNHNIKFVMSIFFFLHVSIGKCGSWSPLPLRELWIMKKKFQNQNFMFQIEFRWKINCRFLFGISYWLRKKPQKIKYLKFDFGTRSWDCSYRFKWNIGKRRPSELCPWPLQIE